MAVLAGIGLFTVFVFTVIIGTIFEGYVLSVLWQWFIVPAVGLPAISVVQAIGIALVVSLLTNQHKVPKETDPEEGIGEKVVKIFTRVGYFTADVAIVWGIAAVVHLFL